MIRRKVSADIDPSNNRVSASLVSLRANGVSTAAIVFNARSARVIADNQAQAVQTSDLRLRDTRLSRFQAHRRNMTIHHQNGVRALCTLIHMRPAKVQHARLFACKCSISLRRECLIAQHVMFMQILAESVETPVISLVNLALDCSPRSGGCMMASMAAPRARHHGSGRAPQHGGGRRDSLAQTRIVGAWRKCLAR